MSELQGLITGLHHITLVTSNQETNRRFYTEILGLRRVKLTVNQDDVYHRHIFFADEKGSTGSAITFFEWPTLPSGVVGLGSPHHLSYTLPHLDAMRKWKAWLTKNGVPCAGPFVRDSRVSLYLRDPDGVLLEITTPNTEVLAQGDLDQLARIGDLPEIQSVTQDMKLATFNHASPLTSEPLLMAKYFDKLLGLKKGSLRPNPDQDGSSILEIGNEERPNFLRYLSGQQNSDGMVGKGSIHHIAMAVEEGEDQVKILKRLEEMKIPNSGLVDRFWFRSLYFRDLEGNLLEVATKKPGYTADESPDKLGMKLVLPAWLEPKRPDIESYLKNTDKNNPGTWPSSYLPVKSRPESIDSSMSAS